MTAIAGFWSFGDADPADRCARMLRAQAVYGPHDQAARREGPVAAGRALYRLLPEDVNDRGPIVGGDGTLMLVADIRLDNREALGAELGLGGELSRLCDAAVLLAALERWDEEALDRIVGDFAFAFWDARRERLLLARDFIGARPLHYHSGDGFFAFATMPKGLHALPEIPYAPCEASAADFLALLPETGTESFFEGIEKVPAGHCLSVTRQGATRRRYWEPRRRQLRFADSREYAEALREQMDVAVRSRLRGAGNAVATHLSAGLDSSTVTASAARLIAPGRVVAFTAVPSIDSPAPHRWFGDEGPLAAATAAMYDNIEHVRIASGGNSPLDALDRNFFLYDRPVLNICNAVWLDAINAEASGRGLKVMLTGQMGNMSISYTGLELLPALLKRARLIRLARHACELNRHGMKWRSVARLTFSPFLPGPVWRWLIERFGAVGPEHYRYSALRPSAAAEFGVGARAAARCLDFHYRPWADGFEMRKWVLGRTDLGNFHKGALAGWGIDNRDPTADRRLVEFCLSVPEEQFILGGESRSLLRRAFVDRLPPEVLIERRKGYQASDWYLGAEAARKQMQGELASFAACGPAATLLDLEEMARCVKEWPTAGWETSETIARYRLALLRGISTGHFLRKASGSNE